MPSLAASDPLTVPTWLTAIFTGILAAGAIVTAIFAILAFRKQSNDVALLQQQVRSEQEERGREAEERRRAQAARVYVTANLLPGHDANPGNEYVVGREAMAPALAAAVHNTSGQPIYDVRVHWVDSGSGTQAGVEDELGTIGPGEQKRMDRPVPDNVSSGEFTVVAYFRDAAALRWTLTLAGRLAPVDPVLQAGAPLIAINALSQSPGTARTAGKDSPIA